MKMKSRELNEDKILKLYEEPQVQEKETKPNTHPNNRASHIPWAYRRWSPSHSFLGLPGSGVETGFE